jgi:hypothetical protein
MPRIDPITGCSVMTNQEFWEAEAQREGREAHELQQDFFDEMDKEITEQENVLRNPAEALKFLDSLVKNWNDGIDEVDRDIFVPGGLVMVESIEEVKICQSFRSSSAHMVARVLFSDGIVRKVRATSSYYDGSFYEPPDYDLNLEVLEK